MTPDSPANSSEARIPDGMVPWHGGNCAPDDWDHGPVLFRTGIVFCAPAGTVWKLGWDHSYGPGDVMAYTPRTPSEQDSAAISDGWVMVPREPTTAMREAALQALSGPTDFDPKVAAWDAMRAYRAMLAASPKPPQDRSDLVERLREALEPFAALPLSTEYEVSDLVHRSPATEARQRADLIEQRDAQILAARTALTQGAE